MTLPVHPNAINFGQIRTEFGGSGAASMSAYRSGGARVPAGTLGFPNSSNTTIPSAGQISFSNFHGAAAVQVLSLTIGSNTQNYNLRNAMTAAGYSGSGAFNVTVTINAGIWVWSDSTSVPAFNTGVLSGGTVTVINNGYIIGKGGSGGAMQSIGDTVNQAGKSGGNAISLGINATIINNSGAYIAGGGGGGVGGNAGNGGGGGAGGGAGGGTYTSPNIAVYSAATAGPGGSLNNTGGNGGEQGVSNTPPGRRGGGGGGGRILPGNGGGDGRTPLAFGGRGGGAGGGGGVWFSAFTRDNDIAGSGGSANNSGGNGQFNGSGGGGGWGASGGGGTPAASAGAGGKAISLNGYSASLSGGGTTYGSVS